MIFRKIGIYIGLGITKIVGLKKGIFLNRLLATPGETAIAPPKNGKIKA